MEKHNFETIFTSDDVLNIQDAIGKGFGSRERALYMGIKYILVLEEQKYHNQHPTTDLVNQMLKLIITDINISPLKIVSYTRKFGECR